jgi:mannose-6-phosphate isomerase-like protein (cupin superfamily)
VHSIHITRASEGQRVLVGADVVTIKAGGAETAGSLLVFETRVLAGGGPPMLHRHAYSEVFIFLSGTFEVSTLGEDNRVQAAVLKAGDTVAIPSMAWHTFKNVGSTPGTFLAIHSPPVMEGLIAEIGRPLDGSEETPAPAGPPSKEEMEHFMRVIGKYMELLPPEAIVQ